MRIFGVDPGVHKTAIALVEGGFLTWCYYGDVREVAPFMARSVCDLLVVEKPQWDGRSRKIKKQDLIDLSVSAGVTAGLFGGRANRIEFVTPKRWKGDVPKEIHNARVIERLEPTERTVVERAATKSLQHNVLDAVGIAFWKIGRME